MDYTGKIPISSFDYAETLTGGISVYEDLFKFHINGSIHEVVLLPDQKAIERCTRVATAFMSDITVTACQEIGRGINLYMTTSTSFKSWTWGPYRSSAFTARSLQIAGGVLMLTDTSQYPEYRFDKGRIYLYALTFDRWSGEELEELEIIDENDLVGANGYKNDTVVIGNSHMVWDSVNEIYRLYITEVGSGLFVVDFKFEFGRDEINILSIDFVDLNALLEKNNLHMPYGSSFQAVTRVGFKYNPHFGIESILVTTKHYDNFEVLLIFDEDTGVLKSQALHRVYKRYAYYETTNEVRASHGYVAISYILPPIYRELTNYTRQIVAVYDSTDYEGESEKGYSERYMLGAVKLNVVTPVMFAFNTTYDRHSNGTREGLVVVSPFEVPSKNMYEYSVSRNLTAEVKPNFKDQKLTLIPYNDFESRRYSFPLINHVDKEKDILAIIIIVLASIITIGFGVYICMLVKNKKKVREERQSLLTEGTLRETIDPTNGETAYVPPHEGKAVSSGSEGDEEDEEEEEAPVSQPNKPVESPKAPEVRAVPPPPPA